MAAVRNRGAQAPVLALLSPHCPCIFPPTKASRHLVRHTRFTPTFFFRNLPGCRGKGAKAKRKHPGRISRSSFPERSRGVTKVWGSGGKGGRPSFVETGSWVVPGGRGETPPPLGKSQGYDNIPAQKGTLGLGLELKLETEWSLRRGSRGKGVWREGWRRPPGAGLGGRPRPGAWHGSQKPGVLYGGPRNGATDVG